MDDNYRIVSVAPEPEPEKHDDSPTFADFFDAVTTPKHGEDDCADFLRDTCRESSTWRTIANRKGRQEWLIRAIETTGFAAQVADILVRYPFEGPEFLARKMTSKGKERAVPPVPKGMARVKWYPSTKAVGRWPKGLGILWTDVQLEVDGSLDLQGLTKSWGMQNCYVIQSGHERLRLTKEPVEKLSAVSLAMLLANNNVIGVSNPQRPWYRHVNYGHQRLKCIGLRGRCPAARVEVPFWILLDILRHILDGLKWIDCLLYRLYRGFLDVVCPFVWLAVIGLLGFIFSSLLWLARPVFPWAVAAMEAFFLSEQELAELERRRHAERRWERVSRRERGYTVREPNLGK
ncbi:uncharacterized protein BXZ73DRAFT_100510 [Epithele typhae]|uniref:uncharacterized protein n=1 Tax=Epithele typhae TaxID=378194 RepID=UPI002008DAE0|nr:uncharacterized protein BXZ73DRAFT_100510 [Epithele typhae]KAH9935117.1 hypothetical protein BXZ73DRAFT_100510 [Epithele typhae]